MKTVSRIFRVLAAALLAQFSVLAAEPASTPAPVNIVFIGDSITYGANIDDHEARNPPVFCTKALQKALNNPAVYYSKQGHCGIQTGGFLPESPQFKKATDAARELNAAHPGKLLFSIMLGTNDSGNHAKVSDTQYHDNLKTIIDQLLTEFPDSRIYLQRPIWYSPNTHNGADYEGEPAALRLRSYFPQIDALVAQYQDTHPGHVFRGDTLAFNHFSTSFQTELTLENGKKGIFFLHPNVAGAEKLGEFWAAAISQVETK